MKTNYELVLDDKSRLPIFNLSFTKPKTDGFTRYQIVTITVGNTYPVIVGDGVNVWDVRKNERIFRMTAYSVQPAATDSTDQVVLGLYFLPTQTQDWQQQKNQQWLVRNIGSSSEINIPTI